MRAQHLAAQLAEEERWKREMTLSAVRAHTHGGGEQQKPVPSWIAAVTQRSAEITQQVFGF